MTAGRCAWTASRRLAADKGLGVVTDPEDVAAWAVVAMAHPELMPGREDHPFRDHSVADVSFEARLAGCAASS
jgi:hypothetical protein